MQQLLQNVTQKPTVQHKKENQHTQISKITTNSGIMILFATYPEYNGMQWPLQIYK